MDEQEIEITGYGALDLNHPEYQRLREENTRQAREIDELIYRVFTMSDDGKKLLAHLKKQFLHADMGYSMPDQQLRHLAGKRELVLEFIGAIDRVSSGVTE